MSFSVAAKPFVDLRKLLTSIVSINTVKDNKNVISWLQSIANGSEDKAIKTHRSLITLFASSNGIAEDVKNTKTKEEIRQLMDESAAGKARLNKMCEVYGHGLRIFDLALDLPTKKSYLEPTLGEKQCAATVAFGMEAIAGGADILSLGALATAGDVAAASIALAIYPDVATIVEQQMPDDFALINRIVAEVKDSNALEILGAIGGREVAAIMGAIISARTAHISVILDDLPAIVAALILYQEDELLITHCRVAICQTELMNILMEKMQLQSVLLTDSPKLNGANSALAMGILKANVAAQ